jgi:hypothetical protein
MIIEKGDAAKLGELAKTPGGRPAGQPPAPALELGGDAFKGSAGQALTEQQRLQAAVDAAKAAQGGTSPPTPAKPAETPWQQFQRGLLGRAPVGTVSPERGETGFWARFKGMARGFAKDLGSDHPVAAIGRGAIRMVPLAGFLVGAADMHDLRKTFQDPQTTLGRKALAGVKAAAGVATIGAGGLLLATGAAAFLPYLAAAGATAAVADVALSRLRTGHW